VQEYKKAPSLAQRRSFTPEDIKQIAVSLLEILVDLQKRTPPVIHRDIKPENILVDQQLLIF
jgi:serine/threonine protein kinase